MRKFMVLTALFLVNLGLMHQAVAGSRGYNAALVDISVEGSNDGIDRVLAIRKNKASSAQIQDCILCADNAHIEILFIKKIPTAFTAELLRKVAKKDPKAIETAQKAMRDFQDKDVFGLDGVFLYEKKDKTVFVYGLGVSPSAKLVMTQKSFKHFLSDNSVDALFQGAAKSLAVGFVP